MSLTLLHAAVRALALKQISTKDMLRVVLKEAGAGCMMGEQGGSWNSCTDTSQLANTLSNATRD